MSFEVVDSLCFESASALLHYEKNTTRALLHCFYSSGIFAAFKPFTASEQMSVEIPWFSCFISAGALVHCSSTGLKFCECKQVV